MAHGLKRFAPALLLLVFGGAAASAHPHVWVTVETTVAYDNGKISGLKHRWAFDDMYAAMAIQGLDTNKDGAYDKSELAELAQINMEGLAEFGYFTEAKLGKNTLGFGEPKDYWLEFKDGVLRLYFTLPFAQPVLSEAEGFTFSVHDQTYFISFEMAKERPVTLASGAPPGCAAQIAEATDQSEDAQRLSDAFSAELGAAFLGLTPVKTVSISCPKS